MSGIRICLLALIVFLSANCNEVPFSPKPRGYPKVEYPEKGYQSFDKDFCSFTFEYPTYAEIVQDTSFFDEAPKDPCWFDVYIPAFDSRLHCSYSPIGPGSTFDELKTDVFEMVDWHNKKANYIDEVVIRKPNGVSGLAFIIEGPAATPFQFFLTDSTDHFMLGSLYFNTQARPDSLAPVYEFVKEDLLYMIETFEWTKK